MALYRPLCSVLYSKAGDGSLPSSVSRYIYNAPSEKQGTALYRPLCPVIYIMPPASHWSCRDLVMVAIYVL